MMNKVARLAAFWMIGYQIVFGQDVTGGRLFQWVQGIEGRSASGRKQFVRDELKKMGVRFTTYTFARERHVGLASSRIEGENTMVNFGEGEKSVVVGAHIDAVPGSPGANDNGGGVAVLLGLIEATKDYDWKYRVTFCFFDQEEEGLLGSTEFVKIYKDSAEHLAMINLDIEGTGEEVYVGPTGGGDDRIILPYVREAVKKIGAVLRESEHYPASDHLSFANRKLENISISIVPRGDSALLENAVRKNWQISAKETPRVMKVMHTPQDRSSLISPEALKKSFSIVRTVLEEINADQR